MATTHSFERVVTIYKENNAIIDDEIDRFNEEHFGVK